MTIYKSNHSIQRPGFLGTEPWQLRSLTDIVVVMGKNGSGKSLLLRTWRNQAPDSIHYVIPERTGDLTYQAQYLNDESDGTKRGNAYAGNFVAEYRRRIIGRVQTYFMTRGNHRGSLIPGGGPAEIERLLGSLFPEFSVELRSANPPYALRRLGEAITQIEQLSSGEAQLLTIGLDILTIAAIWEIEECKERVMLIDEPDAHIHPDMQARLADFICRIVNRFALQVVVATHSTSLMSALGQFGGNRASVIYIDRNKSDYQARPFDEATRELAACLGGHVLMGPLFGAPILLVEGDDDYRIWSQVPRHHIINIAALPCNGEEIKKYQRILENLLASLCETPPKPLGFALLDGDKPLPEPNQENQQRYVKYVRLACHEAENLYLTDTVLGDLSHTWDSASDAIATAASGFGEKGQRLATCKTWDRAAADLKGIISEIATILDPKGIAWTHRVGVAVGRRRPSGELEAFLGPSVVDGLWGPVPLGP